MATGGEPPPGKVDGKPGASYANTVTGNKTNGRKKLNVLDIFLDRKENSINYNLSKDELAKLLFKKMGIDPMKIKKIDTAGYGKIQIELAEELNPESFIKFPSFDIREGLRTKFYRPHHRKDTLVTISWLDLETPDALISHVFGHFGRVKSNVSWVKMKQEENESQLAKMLNNIFSGERQIWMEVDKPIPSYACIDGRKVKIYHLGQKRTCARCQETSDTCPGKSNAKLCEENDGNQVSVESVWKVILNKVGYKEWVGGETIDLVESKEEDENEVRDTMKELITKYPNCDGIMISNLPEETENEEIKTIINSVVLNSTEGVSILQAENSRSRLVKNIALEKVMTIVKGMDNQSFKGNIIHCRPHVPSTPPKPDPVVEPLVEKEASKEKKETSTNGNPKVIPGITVEEMQKSEKSAKNNKKKAAEKERKKRKEEERKKMQEAKKQNDVSNLNATDFMIRQPKPIEIEDFEFSDYSDDSNDSDAFEDSKELQSEDEFLTPLKFTSAFGKKQAELSSSTPNLSFKTTSKRGASPHESGKPNKKRSKSSLLINN